MRVLIATLAFGIGINIDDIVNVIHWGTNRRHLNWIIGKVSAVVAMMGGEGYAYMYSTAG